jgi:hypothetical protein
MKVALFLLVLMTVSFAKDTPDFVLELFRHGARAVEKDKYDDTWGDIGYAELTSVGIRQHYVMGKLLKEKYADLLLPYNPSKIHVYASGCNRTLMSAISQLYGVYEESGPSVPTNMDQDLALPPYKESELVNINKTLNYTGATAGNFQPVPIYSNTPSFDFVLKPYSNCPTLNDIYNNHTDDALVEELFTELKDTIKYFKSLGYKVKDIKHLKELSDAATSAYYYGKNLPGNITIDSQYYKDLLIAYQWFEVYPGLAETIQRQVFSAPIFDQVMTGIKGIQTNTSTTQFVFLGAHETALFTVLAALGVSTPECLLANYRSQKANGTTPYPECRYPDFAANIIFEFYNKAQPYVVVKYEGEELALCGNQTECPLDQFTRLIQNATNDMDLQGYYKYCGVDPVAQKASFEMIKPQQTYSREVVYGMGVTIVVLLATIAMLVRKNNKENGLNGRNIYYAQTA